MSLLSLLVLEDDVSEAMELLSSVQYDESSELLDELSVMLVSPVL